MYNDYLSRFKKYDKLTKIQAKKILDLGGVIIIVPCKCSCLSMYAMQVKKADIDNYGSFENLINHFNYYNCSSSELGKKPSFYIL